LKLTNLAKPIAIQRSEEGRASAQAMIADKAAMELMGVAFTTERAGVMLKIPIREIAAGS
jgi:hypothetical protein